MLFSRCQEPRFVRPRERGGFLWRSMVTDIKGRRSHSIVADGLTALEHLEHRGAAGAEPNSGDGAGILLQLPLELFADVVDFDLPAPTPQGDNTFATGICFLPQDPVARDAERLRIESIVGEEGLEVLGWRTVPVDPDGADIGVTALGCMPFMAQLFLAAPEHNGSRPGGVDLDRRVYPVRKLAEQGEVYFASLSSRTIAYKGMLTTMQLPQFFSDLRDERCTSAIAIVHSRFSTNTFPSWPLAHPFRFVAHNGEINTVRGNRNRMHAREAMLASTQIPRRPRPSVPRSVRPRHPIRRRSTRSSSCCTSRPQPPARRPDDDPPPRRGRTTSTWTRSPGVLAVPRLPHGTVGRPGLRDLHRRHRRRCGVGPQRFTPPRPVVAHPRRPHHPRQRERRAGRAFVPDRGAGDGWSPARCS